MVVLVIAIFPNKKGSDTSHDLLPREYLMLVIDINYILISFWLQCAPEFLLKRLKSGLKIASKSSNLNIAVFIEKLLGEII